MKDHRMVKEMNPWIFWSLLMISISIPVFVSGAVFPPASATSVELSVPSPTPSVSFTFGVPNLLINGFMLGLLGYLLKRWINGTSKSILKLWEKKVGDQYCIDLRAGCVKTIDVKIDTVDQKVETLRHDWELGHAFLLNSIDKNLVELRRMITDRM